MIDARRRVTDTLRRGDDGQDTSFKGAKVFSIKLDGTSTLYRQLGDCLPIGVMGLILATGILARRLNELIRT